MSNFNLIEVKSETGKDYFIEGYVSTIHPDFANDIVDDNGQKATFKELVGKDITMDEDHEEWRDPKTGKLYDGKKNKYPLAKIVDARLDEVGTWVRAKLNKYHPEFESRILPMIKEKYLHSFSIAYKVKDFFHKIIDNIKYRVIRDLAISNIAITGNPINNNAKFNIALKSFTKMEEEKNNENATDYKKKYEEMKASYDKLKSEYDKLKADYNKEESKEDSEESKKELKSFEYRVSSLEELTESLKKENADYQNQVSELKSKLEAPQLKSVIEGKSKVPAAEDAASKVTMWDVI